MEKSQVNNVYKIKNATVSYYTIWDEMTVQFDEIFECTVDLDENDRNYNKQLAIYPDGRKPIIMTIEEIYNKLQKDELKHPQLPQIKGHNSYISKEDIVKTTGTYKPKALIFLADELNELNFMGSI